MARRKGQSHSISGDQSQVQAKREQKSGQNNDFIKEKLIRKSDCIKSKSKVTGSENQSSNAGSNRKSADNTLTDPENAMRKRGNKSENLTIETDMEAEKNCAEPLDNQLSPNNELAVSNDVENIVKSKKSHKRDKKQKRKSQESFNDSLNDSNSPSIAVCDTNNVPHKKKHKRKKAVNDNEASSETNAEGNILPSFCNPKATNEKLHKRKHKKKRAVNDNEMSSENNAEGSILSSACNPKAKNLELADEIITVKDIDLSEGVDDTPEVRSEANTVKDEKQQNKKHKKRKMDKKRVENDTTVFNPNATIVSELEVMTDSGIRLPEDVVDTPEFRSEANTVGNEEPSKKKREKRKRGKNRPADDSKLLSENVSEGNLYPSNCNLNATDNVELATEVTTDSGISLSKGVDNNPETRSEPITVKNVKPQKEKHKKRKKDKKRAASNSELLSENNLDGNLYPSCNLNATTNLELAIVATDRSSSLEVAHDAPEIRSEENTVNSEDPKKKKRKRKMIKNSVVSDSGTLDNNLKENIPPLMEVSASNASNNLELADKISEEASQLVSQQLIANETSSKGANNSDEINSVSKALKSDSPQKKNEHNMTMIDNQYFRDKGLEAKNIETTQDNRLLSTIGNDIRTPRKFGRRKLLVLDLNGLLCEVIRGYPKTKRPYKRVNRSAVFKRPYCDEFLKFCHENFDIGVWSSRKMENVDGVVNVIMEDFKDDLLFCWSASECTYTRHKTIEDHRKPLVLKKLQKLWNKEAGNLPWELGDYSPSNTLLIDDSPYKAMCNPPYTGIFPYPYDYNNENDNALGPGGDLRVYLEGLALAEDVESYVKGHPFGKPAITSADPSWRFYEKIINYYK